MNAKDLLRGSLVRSRDRLLARIDEMREHCLVFPTPNGGCHTLWVLGHVAYVESMVVHVFMRGLENPLAAWERAFDGLEPSANAADYPPFDTVLAQLRATREATLAFVDGLSADDLDRVSEKCPESERETFATWGLALQFVCDHTFMHRSHLADARRATGIERMWV